MNKNTLLLFLFLSLLKVNAQNDEYNGLKNDLMRLNKDKKYDSALLVAKKINIWVLQNEKDTSLNYPLSLENIAFSLVHLSQLDSSISYFKLALSKLESQNRRLSDDYSRILIYLSDQYIKLNDYLSAELSIKEAVKINKDLFSNNDSHYLGSLNRLANLYSYQSDKFSNAVIIYKDLINTEKKYNVNPSNNYSIYLYNLGCIYRKMEKYSDSKAQLIEALRISEKIIFENKQHYESILNELFILTIQIGELKDANYYSDRIIDFYKSEKKDFKYSRFLNNASIFYSSVGNFKKAIELSNESIQINLKKDNDSIKIISSLNNLAISYQKLNEYEKSKEIIICALNIIKSKINFNEETKINLLINLANVYQSIKNYDSAVIIYKMVMNISSTKQKGSSYAIAAFNLGLLYGKIGIYDFAETYLKESISINEKFQGNQKYDFELARVYSKAGKLKQSLLLYKKGFEVLNNKINANFEWLTDNQNELFWLQYKSYYNYIDQFSTLITKEFPEAIGLSYNSNLIIKGKLLEEKLSKDNSIYSINDKANSKIDSLRNQLSFLRKKVAKLEVDVEGSQYKILNATADSLDKELTLLWPQYATQKKNLSITWDQVQANLTGDEAAIEFVRYKAEKDSQYYYNALIVRKKDDYPVLVPLCSENQLKGIDPKEGFSAYYTLVWAPMEVYLKAIKTIYHSPVGLLNNIPFGALYAKKGAGDFSFLTDDKKNNSKVPKIISEKNTEYLLNRYTLHQLTSTRYLAMGLKEKALDKVEKSIALVGGVNYDYLPGETKKAIQKEILPASREANSTKLKYLAGTKIEVDTISKILQTNDWETSLLENDDATEENVIKFENKNAKGVLHIATHGFAFIETKSASTEIDKNKYDLSYNSDPMKRSGLILAGANWAWWLGIDELKKYNAEAEDGILTAAELALLNLRNTKLVVLSACETGLGKVEGGEGVFGLKRALKLAGVEQMIVSLWEVPDEESMELMTLFYQDFAKTQNAIVSFEKAQKAMYSKYPTRPDLWAGFVLVR